MNIATVTIGKITGTARDIVDGCVRITLSVGLSEIRAKAELTGHAIESARKLFVASFPNESQIDLATVLGLLRDECDEYYCE